MIYQKIRILARMIVKFFNFRVCRHLNGVSVNIPVLAGIGMSNIKIAKHETFLNALIKSYYAGEDDVFLDVGVNIGQTLLKFKTLFPNGAYVGIEPNPNCVFYVNYLINANGWKDCTVVTIGVGHENKLMPLYFDRKDIVSAQASATFIRNYRPSTSHNVGLMLPCVRLDDYLSMATTRRIKLVKIDVEGGEVFALEGMKAIISKDKPTIVVEVLPAKSHSESRELRMKMNVKMNNLIQELNYKVFGINEGNYSFSLIPMNEIPSDKSDLSNYNYLLIP